MAKQCTTNIDYVRLEIDDIDSKIIQLLSWRMSCVGEITQYKKKNNVPIFQKDRWQQVLDSRTEQAWKFELNEEFIEQIFNVIHSESVRLQSEKWLVMRYDNFTTKGTKNS